MPDEALLSELCTICYAQKPKYRCPGCKTQTCSLPCYKRHQQRASCNGKRDPAVFVKRSQLATPAGIDQDYNYLKSVERSIDHASRETLDRGVDGKLAAKARERGLHPESLLHRYLVSNRINVERAPKGMSRQKTNQTRTTKRQHVVWTVEWIDAQGIHDLQDNCLASSPLHESFGLLQLQKHNASTRRLAAESPAAFTTKRKRTDLQGDHATKTSKLQQDPRTSTLKEESEKLDKEEKAIAPVRLSTQLEQGPEADDGSATVAHSTDPRELETTGAIEDAGGSSQVPNRSFYLLKPGTSSAHKVLIPLDSRATLTASLQDRTVLEYPTIYVLPESPSSLPSAYLLEEAYNKIRKGEEAELDEAIKQAGPAVVEGMRESETNASANTQIDPQKILDMLKRDVTR